MSTKTDTQTRYPPPMTIRTSRGLRNALDELSAKDERTLANYARIALTRHIEAQGYMVCAECDGDGTMSIKNATKPCPDCDGHGYVVI